ncbi:MAG: tRNA pseudouridine(54/55) synthase Pus10 [Candidatus Bathyarchaeota archaeon]|nr:tRNA pseudouridine(54/55) synthase Pus10 [Candidatus Bathyarchaeota archaeon]
MDILKNALQMLSEHPLCNHCLGRQFALLGYDIENERRGEAVKIMLCLMGHQLLFDKNKSGSSILQTLGSQGAFEMAVDVLKKYNILPKTSQSCSLCKGTFEEVKALAQKVLENLRGFEYKTFLVGVELPLEVAEQEDEFKARFSVTHGESMKNQFSRDIGKQLCKITEKQVDFAKPEVVAILNPFSELIRLQINPLYVSGRYKKLVRGIPQSRWLCGVCSGEGCEKCGGSGRLYEDSIEELIGIPMMDVTEGVDIALHGAGREDVDARMLGSGRPFVLEIKEPRKRFFDLEQLEEKINDEAKGKVKVHKLKFADKDTVREYKKAEKAEKIYRTIVEFGRNVTDEELEKVETTLSNSKISQQTPTRVLHRRANLVREKYIYEAKTKRMSQNRAEIRIHCQGGLYIKELVTGDDGRTKTSVASILGIKATPLQLDVLSVVTGAQK